MTIYYERRTNNFTSNAPNEKLLRFTPPLTLYASTLNCKVKMFTNKNYKIYKNGIGRKFIRAF